MFSSIFSCVIKAVFINNDARGIYLRRIYVIKLYKLYKLYKYSVLPKEIFYNAKNNNALLVTKLLLLLSPLLLQRAPNLKTLMTPTGEKYVDISANIRA